MEYTVNKPAGKLIIYHQITPFKYYKASKHNPYECNNTLEILPYEVYIKDTGSPRRICSIIE